jgi:hypothetical protein
MSSTCLESIDCCPPTPFDYMIHEAVFWNSRQCATTSCLDQSNPVTRCVDAGTVSSGDSQQAADQAAIAQALAAAQAALAAMDACGFYNEWQCAVARCPIGSPIGDCTPHGDSPGIINEFTACVPAGTIFSPVSLADANAQACAAAKTAAEAGLTCLYYSDETWWAVSCPNGGDGTCSHTPITPTASTSVGHVNANHFSSTVSVDAANQLACALAKQLAMEGLAATCTIPTTLNGLLWMIPCTPNRDFGDHCDCRGDLALTNGYVDDVHTDPIPGTTGHTYTVTLRIRGAVELKDYYGTDDDVVAGTNGFCRTLPAIPVESPPSKYGGANRYSLIVSDPPMTWWLNNLYTSSINRSQKGCYLIDYQIVVPMKAGAILTLRALTMDSSEYRANNPQLIVTVPDPGHTLNHQVLPQPFHGQFLQMDVVSVGI